MRTLSLLLALSCFASSLVHAETNDARASAVQSYTAMCKKDGVKIPAEYGGDADIKNHPKLDNYCGCYAEKFADRVLKTTEEVKKKGQAALTSIPAEQSIAEEHTMRKTCRAQFGMPAPVMPK